MPQSLRLFFLYLIPLFLILIFQHKLIIADPLLNRDDLLLVPEVARTTSLSDYFTKLKEGTYYDIQPIRDITFYGNIKLQEITHFGLYHLTNTIIALIILLLFRKFLKNQGFNENVIFLSILLLATHPVFNTTMAWVSNRKHLLALTFILLYALESQKKEPSSAKNFVWVMLSILSQPIAIFIPLLYLAFRKYFEKYKFNLWDYLTIIFSSIFLILNYYFYSTNIRFLGRNTVDALNNELGIYILKLARVPVQLLFPFRFAVEYDPGSMLSFLGIFMLVVLIYLHFKFEYSPKRTVLYLIVLTSLFPVLKWGARDPYLMLALFLTIYVVAEVMNRFEFKKVVFPVILVLGFFSFYSYKYSNMWSHDMLLHKMSSETEGGIENHYRYALTLGLYYPDKAYEIFKEMIQKYPDLDNPLVLSKMSQALYRNPKLSNSEKLKKFREIKEPNVFDVFFESKLLKELGYAKEHTAAVAAIKKTFENVHSEKLFRIIICPDYEKDCEDLKIKINH